MEIRPESQGRHPVTLSQSSLKEMDEAAARIREKLASKKPAEKEEEGGVPSEPRVGIVLPEGASEVEQTKGRIKFTVENGKAKAVVQGLQKQFREAGWKEAAAALNAMAGMLSLSKEDQRLSVHFNDTGFTPAVVEVSVIGAELEPTNAEK